MMLLLALLFAIQSRHYCPYCHELTYKRFLKRVIFIILIIISRPLNSINR